MKFRPALVAACCLALTACGTLSPKSLWPFHKKPKAGPEAVNELTLVNEEGSAVSYPQYWKRNTLVIDLTGISGQGGFAAKLPDETTWPVRVALRVQPGSVGQLEVQAEERNVLPVIGQGTKPVDIELTTSLYTPRTAAIYISWGPVPVFVEAAPAAPEPEFVSPTEVPKSSEETRANDIVPPAEVTPAQPSPGT